MEESCIVGPLASRLKHLARRLQRAAEQGQPNLLETIEAAQSEPLPEAGPKRRHCLQTVAKRVGFRSWTHARDVLERANVTDRGTLMYRDSHGAISNIWCASYAEAREARASSGGFVLPYKHQFQIVQAPYIQWLGLDPADPDWDAIGRDWVEPTDVDAWTRITDQRLDQLLDGWP